MNNIIAGVDEVGVGPIAGPVVSAAVILNPSKKMYKLRDSKILSEKKRDLLYDKIIKKAIAVSIGIADVEEIDKLNIFHATLLAMERAILGLTVTPSLVLIDGRSKPNISLPMQAIVKGDQKIACISAASIVAKVTRDRMMNHFHQDYPLYDFHKHKGYSTKTHQQLIKLNGICKLHRRSFAFIKKFIPNSCEEMD